MKKCFYLLFLFILSGAMFAQSLKVEKPIFHAGNSNEWGDDYVILNTEPIGGMHGVQKANGELFIAINDTLSTANLGLLIQKSTDGGMTWSNVNGINYRGKVEDMKLIRSQEDSVYCFFRIGNGVYSWNIQTTFINPIFNGGYRSFDVEITSTNSIYVFLDSLATNSIIRYSSTTGGFNWINRGLITSSGAMPKVKKSVSGDTLFLNYFGPVLTDTATSVLRVARYRETGVGTVASAGFQDIITGTLAKREYKMVAGNGIVWILYTLDNGKSEVWGRRSITGGTSYEAPVLINAGELYSSYGIDINGKMPAGSGFELVYYSDSMQVGNPTTGTDKIMYGVAGQDSAGFSMFSQVNNLPAFVSLDATKPIIVPLPVGNNTGVAWVGESGAGKKVYWDTFLPVPVEFTTFQAAQQGTAVVLNWSTATETNNQGFTVERNSGQAWEAIGFVEGMGTSTTAHHYTYRDDSVSTGEVSYRLKQTDFDGTTAYSKTLTVEVNSVPSAFVLEQNYPNPFNPSTRIQFSVPASGVVTLKVFDILGKQVATLVNGQLQAGTYTVDFDASTLASGTYFYQVESGASRLVKKMHLIK